MAAAEHRAGIRGQSGVWSMTHNSAAILQADVDDLRFVDTLDELAHVLEAENPPPHSDLSLVRRINYGQQIEVSGVPRWVGTDLNVLADLLKSGMRIYVNENSEAGQAARRPDRGPLKGCIFDNRGALYYDPDYVKKSTVRRVRYENNLHVRNYEIKAAVFAIWRINRSVMRIESTMCGNLGRTDIVIALRQQIEIFSALFGKGRYRRVKEFQELCRVWKKRCKQTNAKFRRATRPQTTSHALDTFCIWMNKECKRRLVKALDPSEFKCKLKQQAPF